MQIEGTGIAVELDDKLADPQTALPTLELAVELRPALGDPMATGPFR